MTLPKTPQEFACRQQLLKGLVDAKVLTLTSRAMVERFMTRWQVSTVQALLMTGLLGELELAQALAEMLHLPLLTQLAHVELSPAALSVLPFRRAREWEFLPLVNGDSPCLLVCTDPSRSDRIGEIKQGLKQELTLAVAAQSVIVKAIDELYPLAAQLPSLYASATAKPENL